MIFKLSGKKSGTITDAELLADFQSSGNSKIFGEFYSRQMHLIYWVCLEYFKEKDELMHAVMQIRVFTFIFIVAFLSGCANPKYQKEDTHVTGVSQPVISLNGYWKLSMNPPENFFKNEVMSSDWRDIQVPGECAMQGFAIQHNKPFVYKKSFIIPDDYAGKTVKLRFEGVCSYARVWINGVFIREHNGSFTQWDCDITNQVKPGEVVWLTIEVTDKEDEISFASGYAKHQIGGILRNVSLLALPDNFPQTISIQTGLDDKYSDATLIIKVRAHVKEKTWINFRLYDMKGKAVNMSDKKFLLKDTITNISLPVRKPEKWDAEHPNLYTLETFIFDKSIVTAFTRTRIGFREIEVKGNKLFVNGQQVKLRGACRQDINPLLGRVSTPEYDKMDAQLAKEANMNYIRTSHYPPTDSFLKYCDEYGIYVEEETAVCSIDTHRVGIYKSLKQSRPGFEPQMISQIQAMITSHQNHPSVIIWSIGNENAYNEGLKTCYDYIKKADVTRPIIFDEWSCFPCSDKPEQPEYQVVRYFRGQSLDSTWTNAFESDGGLGGAIGDMIDDTFILPDTLSGYNKLGVKQEASNRVKMYGGPTVGYGECGIVDSWRRKKTEFWNTKKAYSPVKILINEITDFKAGTSISIPVYNRFNNTNLREIKTKCIYRNKEVLTLKHNIDPSKKGVIQLFPSNWIEGEYVNIKFFQNDTSLIDEYNLRLGKREE
jgi:beta-galactosidase